MDITVILCTYNRCQSLAKALESLAASTLPRSVEWEVLVIDNNSRDQTREVIEHFCRREPGRFRGMFEPRQGKSHALNSAMPQAKGDIVAFTDDDVTVEPTWLQNLTAPLQNGQWAGAAGRIRLEQGFSPPFWLAINGPFDLGGSIVQFDLGDEAGELTKAPFGANMAFRKIMFEKYGGFRTDLGRRGSSLIGNEDTEFSERLMAAGEHLLYEPSAVVNHPVPEKRLTKEYFRVYWFDYGRSRVRQAGKRLPIRSIPKYCLGPLKSTLRWMFAADPHWPLSPQARFYCEAMVCQTAGELVECYRQSQTLKEQP